MKGIAFVGSAALMLTLGILALTVWAGSEDDSSILTAVVFTVSRFDAQAVFAASAEEGGTSARVNPITAAEYPTPARRPTNSRLDCEKLALAHGVRLPPWQASMKEVVERLLQPAEAGVPKR